MLKKTIWKINQLIKKIIWLFSSNKILTLILIIAALLRFVGTNPGYNQFHADEGISYSAAVSMIKDKNLDPLRYDYPALIPEINYLFFRIVFIPLKWVQYYGTHIFDIVDGYINFPLSPVAKNTVFQVYVLGDRNLNALHWGRYVTAFFSLLNVLLVYFLAKKLFEKKLGRQASFIGLLAAFLLTFNFKSVVNSHIGLPDIYNSFFVLLSFISCLNLYQKPNRKNYLLTGFVVGLSFSTKYQIFAVFPFVLTHLFLSFEKSHINFKKLFDINFIVSLVLIPLTFIILNPYFFVHFNEAVKIVKGVSLKYGMGTNQLNLYPFSYWFHVDYGALEFILVFLGIFISIKKFKKELLFLMSFILPFLYVLIYYSRGGFYIRNFITTTPLLMIFASLAIWQIFSIFKSATGKKISLVLLLAGLLAVIFIPARNSIINSYYYTKPWGYDLMRPWIQQNLPKNVTVASHPFDAVNLKITNKRTQFDILGSWSIAEHRENGASYAVLDLNWAGYPFYFWMFYGFDDLHLYWNKPLDIMRNMFFGLATEEQFRYSVHSVTKPWQAPDTHLLLIKFPSWPTVEMNQIKNFNFDSNQNNWVIRGTKQQAGPPYMYDPNTGYSNKGSLVLLPLATKFPIVRLSSPAISIKEGHLYKIDGYLKTDLKLSPEEREGFLRIDFYGKDFDPERVGLISSVSPRVYGTTDWVKKEIVERAPTGAKLLVVSIQSQISTKTKVWLDDVEVQESKNPVEDITTKPPYYIQKMDLNYVYPNSHGNL